MNFFEKDLENIIWESDNEKLINKGLFISGKKLKQLKIGNYGIADLITVKKLYENGFPYLDITVFELKKDKAGISAFLQAVRYCKGISSFLFKRKNALRFKLNIVICGKTIDADSDYIYITDLFKSDDLGVINTVTNYSYDYTIDGIEFTERFGYELTYEGF